MHRGKRQQPHHKRNHYLRLFNNFTSYCYVETARPFAGLSARALTRCPRKDHAVSMALNDRLLIAVCYPRCQKNGAIISVLLCLRKKSGSFSLNFTQYGFLLPIHSHCSRCSFSYCSGQGRSDEGSFVFLQGGWGWLVVGAAFLVQVLTTGLQLAFGVLAAQIARHFRKETGSVAAHMEAGQLLALYDPLFFLAFCPIIAGDRVP